jgi:hypothetical protein
MGRLSRPGMANSAPDVRPGPASKPSHFCHGMRKYRRAQSCLNYWNEMASRCVQQGEMRLRRWAGAVPAGGKEGEVERCGRRRGDQAIKLSRFCQLRTLKLWYSSSLCKDARPSAPSMSCGSRAIQAKPEARSSCSGQLFQTASHAGNREVSVRRREFDRGGPDLSRICVFGRRSAARAGVLIWQWKTNSKTTFRT